MPTASGPNELSVDVLTDPEVRLSLTPRSGPIVVEIEYRVDPAKARVFYAVMQHVQLSRQRSGAYGWSIARDLADPEPWTERYHCPTWHDYLPGSEADRRRRSAHCTSTPTNSMLARNPSGLANVGAPCRICTLERGHARSIHCCHHGDYDPRDWALINRLLIGTSDAQKPRGVTNISSSGYRLSHKSVRDLCRSELRVQVDG